MRFLVEALRKNARRMRLEQWVLLAVRTLRQENLALKLAARMPGIEPMVPGISRAWKKPVMCSLNRTACRNALRPCRWVGGW